MKKRKRRYREKNANLFAAAQSGGRLHDFLKGWGTICKDGSILWDSWRPPTKRQIAKARRSSAKCAKNGPKIIIPMIAATFPNLLASDIVSVQPMGDPGDPISYSLSYDYQGRKH